MRRNNAGASSPEQVQILRSALPCPTQVVLLRNGDTSSCATEQRLLACCTLSTNWLLVAGSACPRRGWGRCNDAQHARPRGGGGVVVLAQLLTVVGRRQKMERRALLWHGNHATTVNLHPIFQRNQQATSSNNALLHAPGHTGRPQSLISHLTATNSIRTSRISYTNSSHLVITTGTNN
jgi:hypothetical protein